MAQQIQDATEQSRDTENGVRVLEPFRAFAEKND